jgi:vitamin B12 transporter
VKHTKTTCAALLLLIALALRPGAQEEDFYPEDLPDFGEDQGVTLVGTPETTQQMIVIEREEIERRNARDLASLLEETLDMSVTRYGGYGNQTELNLRGFDTERIAILIDGVPANSPRSGEFDVSQVDMNNVERIEVIYGGSDTKYNVSGALGGVINIITVKRQPPGFSFGVTASNTGYLPGPYVQRQAQGARGGPNPEDLADSQNLSFSLGHGGGAFSWKASLFGNRAGNHFLFEDDYGFARRKISNEVLDIGGGASLAWNLSDTTTVLSDTKLYYAHKNYPITPNSVGSALATNFQVTENVLFNAPVIFRDDMSAEASLSYQFSQAAYGADIESYDHYATGIARWNWFPTERLVLRSGADWRTLYIDSRGPTETQPIKTGNMGGLYLTGEFSPVRKFMIVASVKGVADTRQAALVPKLGFRWEAANAFTLKNNYFRSFKFPDFDDLYYRSMDNIYVGNPDLKPEDGFGADLVGEYAPLDWLSAALTVFGQMTTDSIHWVKQNSSRWSPANVGEAYFVGLDFRPAFTLRIDRLGLRTVKLGLNYQYQLSWLMNGDLSFSDAYRVPYMPNSIVGGSVDLDWDSGSFLVTAHYEGVRYADTMNEMPLDPHVLLNATANQGIGKHFTVFASLRNILNARYESFAAYYMPGIALTLGVRWKR